jgi:hypothetical protein
MGLGAISYTATYIKSKGSAGPTREAETPIKEEDAQRPPIIKQELPRNLFIYPPETWPDWKLQDFELNVLGFAFSNHNIAMYVFNEPELIHLRYRRDGKLRQYNFDYFGPKFWHNIYLTREWISQARAEV